MFECPFVPNLICTYRLCRGANGSMMIEAVPFFHIICQVVTNKIGEDKVRISYSNLSIQIHPQTDQLLPLAT
jgi:hypothetical protein